MWVYLSFLLVPLLQMASSRLAPTPQRVGYGLIWLLLLIFIGLRREVGCDWNAYLLMFNRAADRSLGEALGLNDAAYVMLNWAAARLGLGLAAVNAVCAALFVTGFLRLARIQPYPALALLIGVPVLLAVVGLGPTRQSAAIGLEMSAFALFLSGRRGPAVALLALAPLFHWTAVGMIPLIPLMFLRRPPPAWLIIAACAALGIAIVIALFSLPAITARVAFVAPSDGAWFRQLPNLIAAVAAVILLIRGGFGERERVAVAFLVAVALVALVLGFASTTAMDRIGYHAIPLQMIALTRAIQWLARSDLKAMAATATTALYLILFVGWLAMTTQKPCYVPYRSYLTSPGLTVGNGVPEPWVHRSR